jgi:hypothetical protein
MEVQVGDRFTEGGFEWEVLTRPAVMHGAKTLRARVVRPGVPETEREVTWQGPRARRDPAQSEDAAVTATRHVCGLCGTAFPIVIPPGDEETARDRLCAVCIMLPSPPPGPDDAHAS